MSFHRFAAFSARAALALAVLTAPAPAQVYTTYHWHMQQPIYWPDRSTDQPLSYEKAWESIQRRNAGAAHPQNDVAQIFGLDDRWNAYQDRPRASIASMSGASSGAQVSYSGCLAENVASLGAHSAYGYSPSWFAGNRTARSWTTPGGRPRMDLVVFPYHHSLAPLIDPAALKMELAIALDGYAELWGASPPPSAGFFPPELAFSERIIPVLAELGVEWSFVSNSHLSRACENFPLVLGTGGENCDPPNRADVLNPPSANWFSMTISRGCTPTNAVPFAYRPHKAQWVDPETGAATKLTVVPVAMAMSWMDGYQTYGVGDVSQIAPFSEPEQPILVALAHDGDNAFGGGYSYYMESVPGFTAQAVSSGYTPTVVQQYLDEHPVSGSDLVHVEDGAWINADGDFGSPDFINWNWPLVGPDGSFDIAGGWAEDERNWAVITAAQNRVLTAEQIAGGVDVAAVRDPAGHGASDAELAWHFFLPALTSGYMYYGAALDMEVKPTVACNEAVVHADAAIGDGSLDATPPTIWLPQQLPRNPGETGFGALWGYTPTAHDRDFWVWTFVDDVSGVDEVVWKYRVDGDGVNPLASTQNETFAGGPEVGEWRSVPMTRRPFPTGNVTNDPNIDFFELPQYIADEWVLHVTEEEIVAEGGLLIDHFVEAVDALGNVARSPIRHTWVGTGGGGGIDPGDRVAWAPAEPVAGEALTLWYRLEGGPLPPATDPVYLHHGFNGWDSVVAPDPAMAWDADSSAWRIDLTTPVAAAQLDFVFHDGAGHWDNHSGQDWHLPLAEGQGGAGWTMDGQLDAGAVLVAQDGALSLWAGWDGQRLYLAASPAAAGRDHFLLLAAPPGPLGAAPWAKGGQVAGWAAFLAQEADNCWSGWFDAAGAALAEQAHGAVVEGSLDLAGELGAVPASVRLALGAFATADGGALQAQLPGSLDGDGSLQAAEWAEFPLQAARPAAVEALAVERLADGRMRLSWSPVTVDEDGSPLAVDGYLVAGAPAWAPGLPGETPLAAVADTSWTDPLPPAAGARRFYRVRAVAE